MDKQQAKDEIGCLRHQIKRARETSSLMRKQIKSLKGRRHSEPMTRYNLMCKIHDWDAVIRNNNTRIEELKPLLKT